MDAEKELSSSDWKDKSSRALTMRSNLLLLLAAVIWGMAFVAQSVGMDYVGPFTFTAVRNYIAVIVLLPFIIYTGRRKNSTGPYGSSAIKGTDGSLQGTSGAPQSKDSFSRAGGRTLLIGGICSGTALACASCLQQIGIQYTTVGKAGFITALYILIVPLLGLFAGKRVGIRVWAGVLLALAGLYLLCMSGGFSISFGDVMLLLCALGFSIQILSVDHFSPYVDGLWLSVMQFIVCGIETTVLAFLFEDPAWDSVLAAWKPVLYAGALSSGAGYTLQIMGQKHTDPVVASLIMSLESAFSLLFGWIILHERLSSRELLGCVLMFIAIILAQLPARRKKSTAQNAGDI